MTNPIALLTGWVLDLVFGDPQRLPHPIVWFGRAIAFCEHRLNKGRCRRLKGGITAVGLVLLVFIAMSAALAVLPPLARVVADAVAVFFCLAGTTLIREVRQVFLALDRSLDEGRRQVARIVGRDTSELSAQEVRTAALETLAENLSDGVIAPLFWLALLGTPGMLAYKMVNTLDSMIGYKTDRYREFGCVAARIDDVANYLPARLTALLMILGFRLQGLDFRPRTSDFRLQTSDLRLQTSDSRLQTSDFGPQTSELRGQSLFAFVRRYGRCHASPNSGYPEAALAGILDCRFGGPHTYFGQRFDKPYIGDNDRPLTTSDMLTAIRINRRAEVLMVAIVTAVLYLKDLLL